MNNPIPVPSKGDGLKASWAASVANGINELMPMASAGMLVRDGAGGVGSEPLPKNQRDRRASTITLPWTFRCTVTNPGTANETRTGGWYNCRMQIGFDASFEGEIGQHKDLCKDGIYYAEVDVVANTWDLKCIETNNTNGKTSRSLVPESDFEHSKVNVFIGTVKDAVCTYSIHCIPVVYKYV